MIRGSSLKSPTSVQRGVDGFDCPWFLRVAGVVSVPLRSSGSRQQLPTHYSLNLLAVILFG